MVSTVKKNTKKSSKSIIKEEILPKEIIDKKSNKISGNGSENDINKVINKEREILETIGYYIQSGNVSMFYGGK